MHVVEIRSSLQGTTDHALQPETADELVDVLATALEDDEAVEVVGRGSKRRFGRPVDAARRVDLSRLSGVSLYEPEELVLRAGAGTALAEIEAILAQRGQFLAFEPPDLGPLLGEPTGAGSLAGAIACNLSGPRRIKSGAARDHVLGFAAVSGRAEPLKSGGRVMKNVTGYDLSKLMAGSFGTLAAMTEVTIKVLPAPEKTRTVLLLGLDDTAARRALSLALGSRHEVSGAAHLPAPLAAGSAVSHVAEAGTAVTAIRVEGPGPSAVHRATALMRELAPFAAAPGRGAEELHSHNSAALWREIRDAAPFVARPELVVWRLSVPPAAGPMAVERVAERIPGVLHYYDWGCGLVWLGVPERPAEATVRGALDGLGGHATLVRASVEQRRTTAVFQPQAPALRALSERVRSAFDPKGILSPGRMYPRLVPGA
jgi:glycolate oxidase FAD binding subunit